MTSELWGEFEHQLDDKGRIIVPAAWRPQLAEGLFLCPGLFGNCLFIWPRWRWIKAQERLTSVLYNDRNGMALQRLIGLGCETKLDGQGRVSLPTRLRARASITSEVLLCGAFDRIEVWNPEERRLFDEKELNQEALEKKTENFPI